MVEIEAIPDETPTESETVSTTREKDDDGWEKLMGDDLLLKITDKSSPDTGKEAESVKPQDAVLINIVGRLAKDKNDQDGPIIQDAKSWLVVVGEGDVLPCIEMAVRFMETGQTGLVWSHSKFAFGVGTRAYTTPDGTKEKIPPHASVLYEIQVKMIVMDTSRLNPYFTLQKATTRKNIANDIYQHEWCPPPKTPEEPSSETAMNRAIRLYTKAAKEMEALLNGTYFAQVEADHPQRAETKKLLLDSLNNTVAVLLKQKKYHKAKEAAVEVLKVDARNLKGLLRAAKASLLDPASSMEEVQAALKAAESEITYKNPVEEKELKQLKQQYKKRKEEYKEQTKAMFGNKLQTNSSKGEGKTTADITTDGDDVDSSPSQSSSPQDASLTPNDDDDDDNDCDQPQIEDVTDTDEVAEKPVERGVEGAKEANKETDSDFWKQQVLTIFLQIVLPLGLYFLYRLYVQTIRVEEYTLTSSTSPVGEESIPSEEIIDLD